MSTNLTFKDIPLIDFTSRNMNDTSYQEMLLNQIRLYDSYHQVITEYKNLENVSKHSTLLKRDIPKELISELKTTLVERLDNIDRDFNYDKFVTIDSETAKALISHDIYKNDSPSYAIKDFSAYNSQNLTFLSEDTTSQKYINIVTETNSEKAVYIKDSEIIFQPNQSATNNLEVVSSENLEKVDYFRKIVGRSQVDIDWLTEDYDENSDFYNDNISYIREIQNNLNKSFSETFTRKTFSQYYKSYLNVPFTFTLDKEIFNKNVAEKSLIEITNLTSSIKENSLLTSNVTDSIKKLLINKLVEKENMPSEEVTVNTTSELSELLMLKYKQEIYSELLKDNLDDSNNKIISVDTIYHFLSSTNLEDF